MKRDSDVQIQSRRDEKDKVERACAASRQRPDLARAFGLTSQERTVNLKSRLNELSRMIWGLMRRSP